MSDNGTKMPLLIEGNYESWRIVAEAVFIALDLWEVVGPEEEDLVMKGPKAAKAKEKKKELAKAKLVLSLSPSQLPFVMGLVDPREMWQALENIHRSSSVASAFSLRRSFLRMVKNESESVMAWVSRVRSRALELSHTPCPAIDVDIIFVIVDGLPEQYESIIAQLDNLPFEQLTIPTVISRLTGHEAQLARLISKNSEVTAIQSSALYTHSDMMVYAASVDIVCHNCGGRGHYARECPSVKGLPKKIRASVADAEELAADSAHFARAEYVEENGDVIRLF